MDDENGWCLNHETLQLTRPWTWISKNFEIASAITKNGIVNCYEVFKARHAKNCVRKCEKSYKH